VLVGRGYSATPERLRRLTEAGIFTLAVNAYPEGWRPTAWCTGDPPRHFSRERIWLDPLVPKFVPWEFAGGAIPRPDADAPYRLPKDCPNVHFFHHRTNLGPQRFLDMPLCLWGTAEFRSDAEGREVELTGGVRSSMLVGLRLLYHFGFNAIVLLGMDFQPGAGGQNSPTYFAELSAYLGPVHLACQQRGLQIWSANPDGHLRVFPTVPFEQAFEFLRQLPELPHQEVAA
jgi:hypothetical protein